MTPIFGFLLVTLVGFAALVTDAGLLYAERRHLQNTVDAAALAGAREFLHSGWTEVEVVAAVTDWSAYNGVADYEVTEIALGVKSLPAGELPTVTVRAERPVKVLFGFVFGVSQTPVGASATAGVSPLRPLKIWPWAVSYSDYQALLAEQQENGEVYLKLGAQGGKSGNFLPLALGGGSGATAYYDNIVDGYDGPLPVQVPPEVWVVPTEPGNMAGPTEQGVEYLLDQPVTNPCPVQDEQSNSISCPLIGLIPVVTDQSWQAASGSSKPVDVINFPIFMVKRLDQDPDAPGQGKGHQVVVGEFLEQGIGVGPTDPFSTLGLFGVRLWD